MNASKYAESILGNCQSLQPQPTNVEPALAQLDGFRAVLFDIYGTLLISASGDIGANSGDHRSDALKQTVELFELDLICEPNLAIRQLEAEIAAVHVKGKGQGVEYPEVDIVEIWQAVLPGVVEGDQSEVDWQRFSLEYEVRVNPVWPMPGLERTLEELARSALVLGVVSNAQFFTPLLFPALLGKTLGQFGIEPALSYFSYEHREAKPGRFLFDLARQQLDSRGIQPSEVLYVGNDMLNDVAAASTVGFRTALFAGDRRSLRLRTDDDRVQGVEPDLVVTELSQLTECLTN